MLLLLLLFFRLFEIIGQVQISVLHQSCHSIAQLLWSLSKKSVFVGSNLTASFFIFFVFIYLFCYVTYSFKFMQIIRQSVLSTVKYMTLYVCKMTSNDTLQHMFNDIPVTIKLKFFFFFCFCFVFSRNNHSYFMVGYKIWTNLLPEVLCPTASGSSAVPKGLGQECIKSCKAPQDI